MVPSMLDGSISLVSSKTTSTVVPVATPVAPSLGLTLEVLGPVVSRIMVSDVATESLRAASAYWAQMTLRPSGPIKSVVSVEL